MNCNDRCGCCDPIEEDRKRSGMSITIPVHKILSWYRGWRNRKSAAEIERIKEYEDVVRDYRQDQ